MAFSSSFSFRTGFALALLALPSASKAENTTGASAAPAASAATAHAGSPQATPDVLPGSNTQAASGPSTTADPKRTGAIGGVSFSDKPAAAHGAHHSRAHRAGTGHGSGPVASFPAFEALPEGGSRLSVRITPGTNVEERRARGLITYVLHGAHLESRNDANALETGHFGSTPVFRAQLEPHGHDVHFVLLLRVDALPTFKVNDTQGQASTLAIDFPAGEFPVSENDPPGAAPGNKPRKGNKKKAATPSAETEPSTDTRFEP